jgi:hypothetical protein
VLAQSKHGNGEVVKAAPFATDASQPINIKLRTLPVVNLSDDEVIAYENNPANKPKMDFKPSGKKAQPS